MATIYHTLLLSEFMGSDSGSKEKNRITVKGFMKVTFETTFNSSNGGSQAELLRGCPIRNSFLTLLPGDWAGLSS